MKKRFLGILLAAAMVVGTLTGCGGGSNQGGDTTKPGTTPTADTGAATDKTVVIGMATDLKTLDPGYMYEVFGNMYAYATYDMLYRIEGNDMSNPKPSVATGYTLSDDAMTYTFKLRDDVTFSSGNKLTAKDVVWTINRVRNLKSNTYAHVEGISDIKAPDDTTVVITLKAPDASFITKLASNAYGIVDSEVVKANGGTDAADAATTDKGRDYLDKNSAGSGPFILENWTSGVELVLKKNPTYWGKSGNVERVIIKEIPDANTQIQMLEKGEIDVAFTLNSDNIGQLEGKEGINILRGQSAVCTFLLMNNDAAVGGPMANPDVQQAVRYALDYKGLKTLCGEGASLPLSIVPQGFVGALTRPDDYQNIEKAKELMAKAGYADGFTIKLTTANYDTEGMTWTTIAQKVQSDLAAIGIKVEIETSEIGVVIDQYREAKVPFLVMHWSPDYYEINNQLVFLPGDTVGARANWNKSDNTAKMTELGNGIIGEADNAVRQAKSEELQKLMTENSPYAFLLQHPKVFAASSKLENVVYNDLCKLQLSELNIK
ncbi:MAG: ABC transporter substrate-binding protein [Oscillospiraceae bacterium]